MSTLANMPELFIRHQLGSPRAFLPMCSFFTQPVLSHSPPYFITYTSLESWNRKTVVCARVIEARPLIMYGVLNQIFRACRDYDVTIHVGYRFSSLKRTSAAHNQSYVFNHITRCQFDFTFLQQCKIKDAEETPLSTICRHGTRQVNHSPTARQIVRSNHIVDSQNNNASVLTST